MSYEIEWRGRGVIATMPDVTEIQDLLDFQNQVIGDHSFHELAFRIIDLSKVRQLRVVDDDIQLFGTLDWASATWKRSTNLPHLIAFVATTPHSVLFAMEYSKLVMESAWEVRVFDTIDGAKAWVGI